MEAHKTRVGAPKSKKRRTRLSPDARRAQLLACAIEAFAERGLSRAAHADVARLAGVAVSSVFHYFPTREALVDAVLDEVERHFLNMSDKALGSCEDPLAGMAFHAKLFADEVNADSDYIKLWLEWSASIREDIWPRYIRFYEEQRDHALGAVQKGLDLGYFDDTFTAEELATAYVGCGHFMVTLAHIPGKGVKDVYAFADRIVQAVLAGARRQRGQG